MATERLKYGMRNAKTSLFFYFVILFVNLFSRKIFLEYLGDDLCGVTTTMMNTIGLLNIADVGIMTAITCIMFKPIYDGDREEIVRIASLFKYLFRIVGLIVISLGLLLICFTPYMVKGDVNSVYIYISFITFLFTSSLSYFFNYRQHILIANQKAYIVTVITNVVLISKILVQMIGLYYFNAGYIFWLLIEASFAVIFSVWLNLRVKHEYPWLKESVSLGRKIRKEYLHLFRSLKQIVSHKVSAIVLSQTDSLVISSIISVSEVTIFANYSMITSRLVTLSASLFSGSWAGVGNLISENNMSKIKLVLSQYTVVAYYVAGVISFCVWMLIDTFIPLWLGDQYLVGNTVLYMLIAVLYVAIVRQPVAVFINGYSLYSDVWAAWSETGINLIVSVVLGYYFGLWGVAFGTALSTFLIGCVWKPFFVYRERFHRSVLNYYKATFKYFILFIVCSIAMSMLIGMVKINIDNFFSFFAYALVLLALFSIVYGLVMYAASRSFRSVVYLFRTLLTQKYR